MLVSSLSFSLHLMTSEPEVAAYPTAPWPPADISLCTAADFIKAGSDIVSVHAEQSSTIHLHRVLTQVKDSLPAAQLPAYLPQPCESQPAHCRLCADQGTWGQGRHRAQPRHKPAEHRGGVTSPTDASPTLCPAYLTLCMQVLPMADLILVMSGEHTACLLHTALWPYTNAPLHMQSTLALAGSPSSRARSRRSRSCGRCARRLVWTPGSRLTVALAPQTQQRCTCDHTLQLASC